MPQWISVLWLINSSLNILHKFHLAVEEDHKDDPKKQKLTAKAFEILGREAVQKEMG